MKDCKKLLLASIAVFFLPSTAFAVYPVITHKAKTHGHHRSAISINYSYEYEKSYDSKETTRTNEIDTVLSYGLTEALDVIFQLPFEYKTHNIRSGYKGIKDISIDAKWKFYDEGGFNLSLYPEVVLPTGNYKRGDGNGRTGFAVTLIAGKTVGMCSFHLNGQYLWNNNKKGDRVNIWKVYFSPEVTLTKHISITGSVGLERDTDRTNRQIPLYVAGGPQFSFSESFSILPVLKAVFFKHETDVTFILSSTYKF